MFAMPWSVRTCPTPPLLSRLLFQTLQGAFLQKPCSGTGPHQKMAPMARRRMTFRCCSVAQKSPTEQAGLSRFNAQIMPGEKSSNTSPLSGVPGKTRTCDPRFRKPMLYPAELRGLSNLAFISVQFGPLLAQDSGRVAMRHRKHSGERTPCHDASIAWLTLPQTGEPSPLAAPKLCLSTPADHASTSRSHGRRRIHV